MYHFDKKEFYQNIFLNGKINNNALSGLTVNSGIPIVLSKSKFFANFNGISFTKVTTQNKLEQCEIERNEYGIKNLGSKNSIHIFQSKIIENSKNGIIFNIYSFYRRYMLSKLVLQNSLLSNHKFHSSIQLNGVWSRANFIDNIFSNNILDISMLGSSDVKVHNNTFDDKVDQMGGYKIHVSKTNRIEFRNNTILLKNSSFIYLKSIWNEVIFAENKLIGCEISNYLIYIEKAGSKITINNNTFQNNFVTKSLSDFSPNYLPYYALSTIKIESSQEVIVNNNIFDNPGIPFEIVVYGFYNYWEPCQCTHNFWGKNVNVLSRIIGQQQFDDIRQLNVFPIYKTENFNELNFEPEYVRGNQIFYEEIQDDLTLTKGEYHLRTSMKISENVTMTIHSGVKLYVWPLGGIEVFGKLNILGKNMNDILISFPLPPNKNISIDDNNLISYDYKGKLFPVCYSYNTVTFDALCLGLGYEKHKSWNHNSLSNSAIKVTCGKQNFASCTFKIVDDCDYQLKLDCQRKEWNQLSFRVNSKESLIKGVTIQNFRKPIYFELLKNQLIDVKFMTSQSSILFINSIYQNKEYLWDRMNIESTSSNSEMTINMRGSLKILNSNFKNIDTNIQRKIPSPFDSKLNVIPKCKTHYFFTTGQTIYLQYFSKYKFHFCASQFETEYGRNLEFIFYKIDSNFYSDVDLYLEDFNGTHLIKENYKYLFVNDKTANLTISGSQINYQIIVKSISIKGE